MKEYPKEFLDLLESVTAQKTTYCHSAYIKAWIYHVSRIERFVRI